MSFPLLRAVAVMLLLGFCVVSPVMAQRKEGTKTSPPKKNPGLISAEEPAKTPQPPTTPDGLFNGGGSATAYSWSYSYDRNGVRVNSAKAHANFNYGNGRSGSTSRPATTPAKKPLTSADESVPGKASPSAPVAKNGAATGMAAAAATGAEGKWSKSVETIDNERVVRIDASDAGIKMVIQGADGKVKTYSAKNADQLKKLSPEAFELYQKYIAQADIAPSFPVNPSTAFPDGFQKQFDDLLKGVASQVGAGQ